MSSITLSPMRLQFSARASGQFFEVTSSGCGDLRSLGERLEGKHDPLPGEIIDIALAQQPLEAWHALLSQKFSAGRSCLMSDVFAFVGETSRLLVHRYVAAGQRHLFLPASNKFDDFINPNRAHPSAMPLVVFRSAGPLNPEYGPLKWFGMTEKTGMQVGGGGQLETVLVALRSAYLSVPVRYVGDLQSLRIPAGVDGITASGISDGMPLAIAANDPEVAMPISQDDPHFRAWFDSWRFVAPRSVRAALPA